MEQDDVVGNEAVELSVAVSAGTEFVPLDFWHGLTKSFGAILVSEIGDETFIVGALLAMSHPRSIVYAGATCALFLMTIISAFLGVLVPHLITREKARAAATLLYTFFGIRLLWIAYRTQDSSTEGEIEEVEEKLRNPIPPWRKTLEKLVHPAFIQAFILTGLAEWGDRSQIATIALAAEEDPFSVTLGAIMGHMICTAFAVVGGRLIATKVSPRFVALVGGLLFLAFAVHAFMEGGMHPGPESSNWAQGVND